MIWQLGAETQPVYLGKLHTEPLLTIASTHDGRLGTGGADNKYKVYYWNNDQLDQQAPA